MENNQIFQLASKIRCTKPLQIKTPAYLHKPGFAELAQLSIKDMQIDLTLRA